MALSHLIDYLSFEFENTPVRIVATRKIPRIETAGILVEETDANREITVGLWVAIELIQEGLARSADGTVSPEEWTQIHYRERFQPLVQLSPLPDRFYARSYFTLTHLLMEAGSDETRLAYLNRLRGMFRDVLESRISKIIRLASSESAASPKDLQPEEALLYAEVSRLISSWRNQVRKLGVR